MTEPRARRAVLLSLSVESARRNLGTGLYAAFHLMRAVEDGLALPLPLVPPGRRTGGGWRRQGAGVPLDDQGGTYFAMITLAIGELIHSFVPRLPGLFGNESGTDAA